MKRKTMNRIFAVLLAIGVLFVSSLTTYAAPASATNLSFETGEMAVVNFAPVWGDKESNIESMTNYIEQANDSGVKLLLFPEMCVTGYASSSDPSSEIYQMAVREAESIDGPTAQTISEYADNYDMWIVYGATERISEDNEHAYNSAFACSPDGEVISYQKIAPVEGSWCIPGEKPVMIQTEWGLMGLSICYDTYAMPELERYYAAKGCGVLLNPTATSGRFTDIDGDGSRDSQGWEWYYKNRLESTASRDGILIASANLVGEDGPQNANGNYTYNFPGGSVILSASFSGPTYYAGADNENTILTSSEGLLANTSRISLYGMPSSTTTVNADFHPDYYASWYKELADKKAAGESLSYYSNVSDGPVAAMVNCTAVWGDKEANLQMIEEYIHEAAEEGVDILVFPETILTGYNYESDITIDGKEMHVSLAETIPGPSTERISRLAQEYNMYIVFGMTEKLDEPMYENGVEKVYNSAAVLFPDGTIESYQKMHRAGNESEWSVTGDTPYIFETPWGKIGVDICRDGHFYPELGRYYAAMGCTMLIHPTATTGGPWYRETRIGSYTDRDGMAAITCNVLGPDGIYNESTGQWSGGIFGSTSLIITKYLNENGRTSFNPETGSALNLNGTGTESEGFEERQTSPEGLEVAKMDLRGCGFNITNFNPDLLSRMYDELAMETIDGYESIYDAEEIELDSALLEYVISYADSLVDEGALDGVIDTVVTAFKNALTEAKSVLENAQSATLAITQNDIDTAVQSLINTIHYLEFKTADKTQLNELIALAQTYEAKEASYITSTFTPFTEALANARVVAADGDIMDADVVSAAWKELTDAVLGLRLIPNKSALSALLNKASAIDVSLYTADSVSSLQSAKELGYSILNNTESTEEDVKDAQTIVTSALNNLVFLSAAESSQPSGSSESSNTERSEIVNNSTVSNGISNTSNPKTGDQNILWISTMLVASSILIMRKASKKHIQIHRK